jgi:hypothetical protein
MTNVPVPGAVVKPEDLEVTELDGRLLVSKLVYEELMSKYRALKFNYDQARANGAMLDSQVEEIARVRKDYGETKEILDKLTVYVREQFAEEIRLGLHMNMRTSVDAAIYYLGKFIVGGKR